jgi:hypothetical protein
MSLMAMLAALLMIVLFPSKVGEACIDVFIDVTELMRTIIYAFHKRIGDAIGVKVQPPEFRRKPMPDIGVSTRLVILTGWGGFAMLSMFITGYHA